MTRFLFIISGDDNAAEILRAFTTARVEILEAFDIVVFDNATTGKPTARDFAMANQSTFGAVHTLARRINTPLPAAEARAAALEFAGEHFKSDEIEIVEPAAAAEWNNPASAPDDQRPPAIESFCTVATENFLPELLLLIHSLRSRNDAVQNRDARAP